MLLALATVATAWSAYQSRFRDEFKPAFAAWLATKAFTNPSAPGTPFAMPQYRVIFLGTAIWLATFPVRLTT